MFRLISNQITNYFRPAQNFVVTKIAVGVLALYQLSYATHRATAGLEPATSPLQADNQLRPATTKLSGKQISGLGVVYAK